MVASILPLTLQNAQAKAGSRLIVGPVDLTISNSGFTIVMGPNGSGKTTLLRLMHGLQKLSAGKISWNCPHSEAQARQGFVFQAPVMMRRSVLDNIAYPLILHGAKRADARAQAALWAGKFGLSHVLDQPAPALSGGERQKLSLARALIRKPDILFLDEPCANLDGRATREIETILSEACASGVRVVMSTHDIGQARRLASEVVFLYDGKLHEKSPASGFFEKPNTPEAAAFLKGDIVE